MIMLNYIEGISDYIFYYFSTLIIHDFARRVSEEPLVSLRDNLCVGKETQDQWDTLLRTYFLKTFCIL